MHSAMLGLSMPGGSEWIVIALFGLLLFGKRLPEVARAAGKSVTEFKKGLQGLEEEMTKETEERGSNEPQPSDAGAAPNSGVSVPASPELAPPPAQ